MKKCLAVVLVLVLACGLAGCGGGGVEVEGTMDLSGAAFQGHFSAVVRNLSGEYLLGTRELGEAAPIAVGLSVNELQPQGQKNLQLVITQEGEDIVLYDYARDGGVYGIDAEFMVAPGPAELKFVGACKSIDIEFIIS